MNKVYKVVWNASLGVFVAVSELASARGKSSSTTNNAASSADKKAGIFKPAKTALVLAMLFVLPHSVMAAENVDANNLTVAGTSTFTGAATFNGGITANSITVGGKEVATSDQITNLETKKADKTAVDALEANKADKTAVDVLETKKADKTAVDALETKKADKTAVDALETKKADKTAVDALETKKADKTAVDALETKKADKTAVDALEANKADKTALGLTDEYTGIKYFRVKSTADDAKANATDSVAIGPKATTEASATKGIAIGDSAKATGVEATAVGPSAQAGDYGLAAGSKARADGVASVALGQNALATSENSVAIGKNAKALAADATAIGHSAQAGNFGLAAGSNARANGQASVALGQDALSNSQNTVAIGKGAQALPWRTISIGQDAGKGQAADSVGNQNEQINIGVKAGENIDGQLNISIGQKAGSNTLGKGNIALGQNAGRHTGGTDSSVGNNIAIGTNANRFSSSTGVQEATAIGFGAKASGTRSVALGKETKATAVDSVAIGTSSQANGTSSVAIGLNANVNGADNVALGAKSVADTKAGNGYLTGKPSSTVVSVGNDTLQRRIVNVADGADDQDAVTVAQLKRTSDEVYNKVNAQINGITAAAGGGINYDNIPRNAETNSITLSKDNKNTIIGNVAEGTLDTDAVNVKQLNQTVEANKTHYFSTKVNGATQGNYNNDGAKGDISLAIGMDVLSTGDRSVTVGNRSTAESKGGIAIGALYEGSEDLDDKKPQNSQTVAKSSNSNGFLFEYNMAIGAGASSEGNNSIAIGSLARTTTKQQGNTDPERAIAIGYFASASDVKANAIGDRATSSAEKANAFGSQAFSSGVSSTAIGTVAQASGQNSIAMGTHQRVTGANSGSIGYAGTFNEKVMGRDIRGTHADNSTRVSGKGTYSVGNTNSAVTSNESGIFGNDNFVQAKENIRIVGNDNAISKRSAPAGDAATPPITTSLKDVYITGHNNQVDGAAKPMENSKNLFVMGAANKVGTELNGDKALTITDSYVIGTNNTINTSNTPSASADPSNPLAQVGKGYFILGNNVTATKENSVYLGTDSAYIDNGNQSAQLGTPYNSATIDGVTYNYAGGNAAGVVTVGNTSLVRRIQGVAAGKVAPTSTDAINGSQLYAHTRPLGFAADNTEGLTNQDGVATATTNFIKRASGQAIDILGGANKDNLSDNNIGVNVTDANTIEVKLAEKIDLGKDGSVTAGDTTINDNGLTINGGPSVTKDGLNNGGNNIVNVKGNLAPTYNTGDMTIGEDGKPTTTAATAPTKSQVAPTPAEAAKIYNNAATVGDVLNSGWNLQGNGTAVDFVKPYDTVNFVNGANTAVNVTASEDGKTNEVIVNVTGLPISFVNEAGDTLVKVGDKFYKTEDVENGKPKQNAQEQKPAGTSLVGGDGNKAPQTLANVKSSIEDGTDKSFKEKLAAANDSNPNNAVNVSDLKTAVDDLIGPSDIGGFGLKDKQGDEFKQSLGTTAQITGDDNINTKVIDAVDADGKPVVDANGKPVKALEVSLNNDITIGKDGKPGSIGVAGQDGKDGVSIKGDTGKDGKPGEATITVGRDGKDGDAGIDGKVGVNGKDGSAVVLNGKDGSIGLNGKDGKDGLSLKSADGAQGVDGTNGADGLPGKDGKTRLVYQPTNPDGTPNGDPEQVATLNDGLIFTGNNEELNRHKLNTVVKVVGEGVDKAASADFKSATGNINVVADKNDKLEIQLNRDLKDLGSATFVEYNTDGTVNNEAPKTTVNNNGITITPKDGKDGNVVSVTKDGLNNGGNNIVNVKGNLAPTYNTGDMTIGEDGKPTTTAATAPTKSQVAPTPAEAAKIYNNAATVGDVLNSGWNLQGNGTAVDFVKPYDTVNFVNGANTAVNVTASEDGKTNEVIVNVTGLPISFVNEAGDTLVKVGDKFYKTEDVENGKPKQNAQEQKPAGTSLVGGDGNKAPQTLANVKSSIEDGTDKSFKEKLAAANDSNPNNAVNVSDLKTAVDDLIGPSDIGGFGLKDKQGDEFKQSLGTTAQITGDDNINTKVIDAVDADGKPVVDANGKPVKALEVSLNNDITIGKDGKPGSIGVAGQDGKDGVSIKGDTGKDGKPGEATITVGRDGKDGDAGIDGKVGVNGKDGSAVVLNGKDGSIGLNGKDGKDGLSLKSADGAEGVDGTNGADGLPGKDGKTRLVYQPTNPDGTPNGDPEQVATLNDGLIFTGNNEELNRHKLNTVVKVVGEGVDKAASADFKSATGNINVVADKKDTLEIQLNRDLKDLGSATFVEYNDDGTVNNDAPKTTVNNDGITITPKDGTDGVNGNVVSVTKDGLNNGGNNIVNVKGNLAPTYNTGDMTIGEDGKPTTTAATAPTKSQVAPTPAEAAKIYNNAATVGDVLNSGWNLQGNGTAVDFVKPYDTVNFVNGANTAVNVTASEDGKTNEVIVNVTGLPISFVNEAGDTLVKVGDKFYKTEDVENGKPKQNAQEQKPAGTSLVGGDGNKAPQTLANVKSSIEDGTDKSFKEKLAAANDSNPNNAVNVSDLKTAVDDLIGPSDIGGFGLKDKQGDEFKQSLGTTAQITGDDNINTKVIDAVDADGKPVVDANGKPVKALEVSLNNDITIGKDGKPGSIGVAGQDGKDGVSIKGDTGKDGKPGEATITVGRDGKDGDAGIDGKVGVNGKDGSAVVLNGKDGSIGLNGKDGKDGLSLKSADGAEGVDGTNGADGLPGKEGKTRLVYQPTNPDGTPNGDPEQVATLNDGLIFTGNNEELNRHKLNTVVKVVGEGVDKAASAAFKSAKGNINVVADKNDKLEIQLNRDLKDLGSATFVEYNTDGTVNNEAPKTTVNNNGITITPKDGKDGKDGNVVSVTKDGLNNGGNTIVNVAKGTNPTDAVNVSQLKDEIGGLENRVNNRIGDVADDANAGVSSAMAMAVLPQAYIPGKSMLTGGIGSYNGEGAVAVGFSKLSDNGRWVLKISGSADTEGNAGGAVGAGFHF